MSTMNVKGTIRYSSDRPCSFRMSTLVITLILLRIITLFTMPVPGEYNLKGIFITLWLTVGRARTERAWRVRLSPRARRCGLRPRSLSSCIPKPPSASSERCATRQAHALTTARLCSQEDAHRVRGSSRGHVRYPALWLEEAAPVLRSIREHPISVLVTRRALGDEI